MCARQPTSAASFDADDDKTLLHVGASASIRNPTSGVVTYSSKPESSLAPVFVTTGNLTNVDGALLLGGEVAGQIGPVHAAAEYLSSQLDAENQNDPRDSQSRSRPGLSALEISEARVHCPVSQRRRMRVLA